MTLALAACVDATRCHRGMSSLPLIIRHGVVSTHGYQGGVPPHQCVYLNYQCLQWLVLPKVVIPRCNRMLPLYLNLLKPRMLLFMPSLHNIINYNPNVHFVSSYVQGQSWIIAVCSMFRLSQKFIVSKVIEDDPALVKRLPVHTYYNGGVAVRIVLYPNWILSPIQSI